jgi:hypothetical protein
VPEQGISNIEQANASAMSREIVGDVTNIEKSATLPKRTDYRLKRRPRARTQPIR